LSFLAAIKSATRKTQNPDRGTETGRWQLSTPCLQRTRKTQNPDRGTETSSGSVISAPQNARAKPKIPIAGLKPDLETFFIASDTTRKTQNPDRGTETLR